MASGEPKKRKQEFPNGKVQCHACKERIPLEKFKEHTQTCPKRRT